MSGAVFFWLWLALFSPEWGWLFLPMGEIHPVVGVAFVGVAVGLAVVGVAWYMVVGGGDESCCAGSSTRKQQSEKETKLICFFSFIQLNLFRIF